MKIIKIKHDRQFRKGKLNALNKVDLNDKTELKNLGKVIDYFKNLKAEFKTLDTY